MARYGLALLTFAIATGFAGAQSNGRAGDSEHAAWYALPSDTGRYVGYYVGGGKPSRALVQNRKTGDGTWGWDYRGFCIPSHIILDWYHGCRYQGGQGAYRTDGPKLVPAH
jgi:hypothetical protein